jgi:hypothetical protein
MVGQTGSAAAGIAAPLTVGAQERSLGTGETRSGT